jgi:integrase
MGSNLDRANDKLTKVKILARGRVLSLRGRFPPRPGDGSTPKRYIVSTGIPNTPEGIKIALAKAQQIEIDLIYDRFSWNISENSTVQIAVEGFEENFWKKKKKTLDRAKNYQDDYYKPFVYLPQDEPLSEDLLKRALESIEPDSRQRLRYAIAYGALAKFAGLSVDLSELKGSYQPKIIREIPTEAEIEAYWESLKNPAWQWVFGIIAAYGLRPHEIFHCDVSRLQEYPPILQIGSRTKTGSRIVYPIPDESWIVKWQLWQKKLPNIEARNKSNRVLGGKISQRFRDYHIPSPYHFRDAYAIRGVVYNQNPSNVAKWMGHSLDVHHKKYLRHMEEKHFSESWVKNRLACSRL